MEKQGKEASELQALNRILAAMNKLLTEENDRQQKEVSQLVNENGFMRQQVNIVSLSLFIFIHYYSFFL
jgi:homeobox-leucine zipper protein